MPLSLAVEERFNPLWLSLILIIQLLDATLKKVVANNYSGIGWVILGWSLLALFYYYCLVLSVPAQNLRLVEDGLEVKTRRKTRVYPLTDLRGIRKSSRLESYRLTFAKHRFIAGVAGPGAEAFMTELSARSGVPILPPRLG